MNAYHKILRRLCAGICLTLALAACAAPEADQVMSKASTQPKPQRATATATLLAAQAPTAAPTTAAPTAVPTATPAATPAHSLAIGTQGGEWQFDHAALEAPAGEPIALTFTNNAKSTPHNWVLVRGDASAAAEVNTIGMQAGDALGYIPADPRIVAHTNGLVKGGAHETVLLSGLPAGTYTYVCTVPGHLDLGMQGVLELR